MPFACAPPSAQLRRAVFAAEIGRLRGPLNVRGSWWVFRVDRELPARQLSLSESTPRIRISIRSTREQLAFDRLTNYLTRRYRPHTVCHNGYTAPECRNGKIQVNDPREEPMTITIAGTAFDYHDYDARGDTLFLGIGGPRQALAARAYETPEGHIVEYDGAGSVIALELVNVRWSLERDGEVKLTCPEEHHVTSSSLEPVLAA